jgi:tRNA (guanine-N(7)-)-methyltransferase subunit TRM82
MPKRPCALAVTDDDSTIITADKFGDVYSLPLILSEVEGYTTPSDIGTPAQAKDTTPKPFIPAANHLTVHSQRNRKALENQRQQANKTSQKSEPTFEHKLLLGHVSMLTDVALAGFQGRSYIITADRDEHIRISRGIAQSHIIEGFCLGHTEFVSRLCIPQGRSNLLISGGGDDELFVWDWLSSSLISKADLRSLVEDIICDSELGIDGGRPIAEVKVAVSGISHARLSSRNGSEDIIIATCEG